MTIPKPRQFKYPWDPKELQEDLTRYAKEAIALGATDAKPIRTSDIVIDERVRLKCLIPKCAGYGECVHCPPHALPVETVRKMLDGFQWGVLIKIEVDPKAIAGYNVVKVINNLKAGREDPNAGFLQQLDEYNNRLYSVVGTIESMSFYDGHHLAMGFGNGSCQITLCKDAGCKVLKNGTCRFPLRSRPSMESCGMDVFKTVTNVGWTIYPLGTNCDISEVSHGALVGLVLIE
jgi:predicted metal-binding protein